MVSLGAAQLTNLKTFENEHKTYLSAVCFKSDIFVTLLVYHQQLPKGWLRLPELSQLTLQHKQTTAGLSDNIYMSPFILCYKKIQTSLHVKSAALNM